MTTTLGRVAWILLPLVGGCASKPGGTSSPEPTTALDGGENGALTSTGVDGGIEIASDGGSPSQSAPEASAGATPDDAGSEGGTDAGGDSCAGLTAVVGGTVAGASTIAFAATLAHGGSWAVSSLPSNVASPPAIASFGDGFVVVFVDATGALEFATSTWTWSSPASVAGVTAESAPSLAVAGTSLHLVYQATDAKYAHGTYTIAAGWDAANDPVGGASKQGFGPSAPVAASVAGDLVIAYGGQNGFLYDETWTDGAWAPDEEHTTAQIGTLSPAIAALSGGASDTLVVYANTTGTLYATSRSAGAWSSPAVINANAFTNAAPSLVALSAGRALMAYLGTDEHPYFSVYDPSAAPPWTSPSAIGTGSPILTSPPSIAPGVCGDDAVAVLAEAAGVTTVRYASGAWLPPTALPGTAGMTFASVASRP